MKNPIRSIRDYWNSNITKPLFTSAVILILAVVILVVIDFIFKPGGTSFWDNIFAELHGMLFDVAIILFLFNLIESKRQKKLKIERYKEEIEDYRTWDDPEATHRLRGLIRRMNNEGETKLNLSFSSLKGVYLSGANLTGTNLIEANLSGADLIVTNLSSANISGANLIGTNLSSAKLCEARLSGARLSGAQLSMANLSWAVLIGTDLSGADLSWANLSLSNLPVSNLFGANLYHANLSMAILTKAILIEANLELWQLKKVISLKDATMMDGTKYDESWAKRIEESVVPDDYKKRWNLP